MVTGNAYPAKFARDTAQTVFAALPARDQAFIRAQAERHRFTQQELRLIVEIAADFAAWNAASIIEAWPTIPPSPVNGKPARQRLLAQLHTSWEALKTTPPSYHGFGTHSKPASAKPALGVRAKPKLGLGHCPVASTRTRCCNLMTLDAVENCGFGCSYCSIQSFYNGETITFDSQFADKLRALELDPERTYHIGTGQSSDSLLFGNRHSTLDALTEFAHRHPNVILEFKTKSKNVAYLLHNDIPKNILSTWSLNTPAIITNEEHQTASLTERLRAARKVADRGLLVGFHFHPMVHYDRWRRDYAQLFESVVQQFDPAEVALVSFGTLTFTKSVIRTLRARQVKSKVLQMPLVDADGKLSYPEPTKLELFRFAYQRLAPWHADVFFYLCMENPRLWQPVFGYDYPTNDAFETAMKTHYINKIK